MLVTESYLGTNTTCYRCGGQVIIAVRENYSGRYYRRTSNLCFSCACLADKIDSLSNILNNRFGINEVWEDVFIMDLADKYEVFLGTKNLRPSYDLARKDRNARKLKQSHNYMTQRVNPIIPEVQNLLDNVTKEYLLQHAVK